MLGWPEIRPDSLKEIPPKPIKSDYLTDELLPYHEQIFSFNYFTTVYLGNTITVDGKLFNPNYSEFNNTILKYDIETYNNEFLNHIKLLKSGTLDKEAFISEVIACNVIIYNLKRINSDIIQHVVNHYNQKTKELFAEHFKIRVDEIPTFKLPYYDVPELKKQLVIAIDEGFNKIYDKWRKLVQKTTILTHNNSQDDDGRHTAPNNVNISSVIALNLTCNAIEGSYQINLDQSNKAEQSSILYSFAPSVSPGFLIIEDPINPVYMQCNNNLLTVVNFSLTDQSNNLIDLRGETLAISLFVKS